MQIQVTRPTSWNGHRRKVGERIDATSRIEIGCARALVQLGVAIETPEPIPDPEPQPTPPPAEPEPETPQAKRQRYRTRALHADD